MSAAAAAASHAGMAEAAREVLRDQGSAVDALVAAFFALAGEEAGGLLAPVVALVGGAGAGARAIDGRAQQPGRGAPRPRGILAGAPIPLAARVAAPRALAALFHLHAAHGRGSLAKLARAGVARAAELGEEARSGFLRRVASEGVPGLAREAEALLRVAGGHAGGLLTEEDLSAPPDDLPAEVEAFTLSEGEPARALFEPWSAPADGAAGLVHVAVAADARGVIAALAVHLGATAHLGATLRVPELGLALPLVGEPVMRGHERVRPGTPIEVAPALALLDAGASVRVALARPAGLTRDEAAAALREQPAVRGISRLSSAYAVVAGGRGCETVEPRGAPA